MEIMDEVIQKWLANDTSNKTQYCNGLRIDTKDELTIKNDEKETPFNRFYNDENLIVDFSGEDKIVVK
jgi:hypothetical protein